MTRPAEQRWMIRLADERAFPYCAVSYNPRHFREATHEEVLALVPFRPAPPENDPHSLMNVMGDGAWAGRRCFCLASGPSAAKFDLSVLRHELVIGVNRAYEMYDPTILFTSDIAFVRKVLSGRCAEDSLQKYMDSKATRVFYRNAPTDAAPKGYYAVNQGSGWTIRHGLVGHNNSGFGAVALAIALGASEIYLVGYDMCDDDNRHWCHSPYPDTSAPDYDGMLRVFDLHAKDMKARARIVNLNPKSRLRCFPFGSPAKLGPRPLPYQVISFYTKGTGYEDEIKSLEASLKEFKLPYHFFACPPKGSWRKNLNHKSKCIRKAMDMFPNKDIVFLDSDAVVQADPVLFEQLSKSHDCDLSAHFYRYTERSGDSDELLSGTLWIQNSETGRELVNRWHEIGLEREDMRHQMCLKMAVESLQAEGREIRVNRHPFAYTCVFDYPQARQCEPIIMHYQASRRRRREVGYGDPLLPNGTRRRG